MTTVVIFHSVLGIRQGEIDAAARLTAAGHEAIVPDLFDGRVFDEYDPAIAWSRQLGDGYLEGRALASVAEVSDGTEVLTVVWAPDPESPLWQSSTVTLD